MAAKRKASGPAARRTGWGTVAVLAVVLLVGIGGGALLSQRLSPRSQSVPPPPAPPGSPPISTPPRPAPSAGAVTVDTRALDAAVRRALDQIGSVPRFAPHERSVQHDGVELRWVARTAEVRLRAGVGAEEAAGLLRKEVERAGGRVLAHLPSGVRIGVVRGGRPLVTHELRLLPAPARARVAIIFDDAGGSLTDLEAIISLGRPVTVAVLPGLRFSREVAERARAAGLEVFLHLPLEPEDAAKDLGPGGVTTAMSDAEIDAAVRADLAGVPGAVGVNNHMGSRGTTDERVMRAVLQVIKQRRLIFVDSVTSGRSVAGRLAAEMGIPTANRQVFLDNEDDPDAIRRQVGRLLQIAGQRGTAVAIGHAQRMTAKVVKEMLAEFDRRGIVIVPVSAIVR